MNETLAIVEAFGTLARAHMPCAMATVVAVSGSSYRRPGARLLAAVDGRYWGGVSGGCLERDVLRQLRLMATDGGPARVVRYDTSDDDGDFGLSGVALGCQGIIDLLLEPVSERSPGPIPFLRRAVIDREPVQIATVIQAGAHPVGTCFEIADVPKDAAVFIERLVPPQSLILFGGGPDVTPVIEIARALGWRVTVVVTPGSSPDYRHRFAAADDLLLATDDDPLGGATIDPNAAVVLMTHNYPRDLSLLPELLSRPLAYLGILGPRRRAERLVLETPNVPADAMTRIHAPVGLDLGADTPPAIALAIVAEIQAILAGRPCPSLRDRQGPIYPQTHDGLESPYTPGACPMSA